MISSLPPSLSLALCACACAHRLSTALALLRSTETHRDAAPTRLSSGSASISVVPFASTRSQLRVALTVQLSLFSPPSSPSLLHSSSFLPPLVPLMPPWWRWIRGSLWSIGRHLDEYGVYWGRGPFHRCDTRHQSWTDGFLPVSKSVGQLMDTNVARFFVWNVQ